jgi:DNA-binding transcriptional MerR regulator
VSPLLRYLSPSEAAKRLGISIKALRLYEQRGLVAPSRTPAGWRAFAPEQMARATEIVALRALGLSLAQIERLLNGDPAGLEPVLAAHQATLEDRIHELTGAIEKVRHLRDELVCGHAPTRADVAHLLLPPAGLKVALALPWPWGGEQVALDIRPLTYVTGPLGSGKTRLALRLSDTLPNAAFLGLQRSADGAAAARARLDADPALVSRVEQMMSWLIDEGAVESDALTALIVALQSADPAVLVIDMVEQGLDRATQEALGAYLRQFARTGRRSLVLLTRSSAILDLSAAGSEEAIILCPANHSPPIRVAPHAGTSGYEALASCLASPEVRARTEGVIAWRPQATPA